MIATLVLAAAVADPLDRHLFVLRQGDHGGRYAFRVETPAGPLPDREAALLRDWKPSADGGDPLDRLVPEGRLLRVEQAEPSPHAEPLTRALFAALDADEDGKLSRAELRAAAKVLLAKFDADGDDCLTPLEIVPDLLTAGAGERRLKYQLSVLHPGDPAPKFGAKGVPEVLFTLRTDKPSRAVVREGRGRIDAVVTLHAVRAEVPKALLRPGREDDRKRFEAVAAEALTLTLRPQARGFFELLDADGDGQLSVRELRRAWELLADDPAADEAVTPPPARVHCVSLTLAPGTATRSPVRLTKGPPPDRGPEWFRALDRNGDGDVSRKEFAGTDEQFKQYDADGDGLISADEAEAGDKKLKTGGKP